MPFVARSSCPSWYKKGGAKGAPPSWRNNRSCYLFFAAFFFAFFAIYNPPFRSLGFASHPPHAPAHSAAWHVGPGVNGLASRAGSRRAARLGRATTQKKGVLHLSTPKLVRKNYRFFAAFFFPPLAFFAIVFSSGCCDSASDGPLSRHNGWAEPSTLIPDVDYE